MLISKVRNIQKNCPQHEYFSLNYIFYFKNGSTFYKLIMYKNLLSDYILHIRLSVKNVIFLAPIQDECLNGNSCDGHA